MSATFVQFQETLSVAGRGNLSSVKIVPRNLNLGAAMPYRVGENAIAAETTVLERLQGASMPPKVLGGDEMRMLLWILLGLLIAQSSYTILAVGVGVLEFRSLDFAWLRYAFQPAPLWMLAVWSLGFLLICKLCKIKQIKYPSIVAFYMSLCITIIVISITYRLDFRQILFDLKNPVFWAGWLTYVVMSWLFVGGGLWVVSKYEEQLAE